MSDVRHLTILGATGSIGTSTLDVVRARPDCFRIEALSAWQDVAGLAKLAIEFDVRMAVIGRPDLLEDLRAALFGTTIECAAGDAAIVEAAARPAEMVIAAIVGAAGLAPTLAAIRRGALIGLANKECLVCAGEVMKSEVARCGARLLPVDSEHNAIFQAISGVGHDDIDRLTLTASGGPFRDTALADMAHVTPAQAIAHPNWSMGAKISVDSATMMNKALEIIEACHLFDLPEDRIDVLVHRQSIVHSLATFKDGSTLAQLSPPDMRVPIAHVLAWPNRLEWPAKRLDLAALSDLSFENPDIKRFPALRLARQALQAGGAAPTLLNAANEVAVAAFLAGSVGYLDIAGIVEMVMQDLSTGPVTNLQDIMSYDAQAREMAHRACEKIGAAA